MASVTEGKAGRLLNIYTRLVNGNVLKKQNLHSSFGSHPGVFNVI